LLSSLPSENLAVQPANRGTAPAILYGVLKLGTSNLGGPLAIFPSDHYVSDDERFMAHVDRAFQIIRARPDLVVLLGVAAETLEQEFGWIEPGEALGLVAYPFTLLTLGRQALPSIVDEFIRLRPRLNSVWELSGARRLYSRLPTTDFSTHILAGRAANLAVLRLDGVGWSDLGRPGRVLAALAHAGTVPEWADHVSA
jgi:mannose-1-phosphate guanylyltransferase